MKPVRQDDAPPALSADLLAFLEQSRSRLLTMLQRRFPAPLAARLGPEDLLHDTFCAASARHRQYQEIVIEQGRSAFAWLYRIAHDELLQSWRKHTRHKNDVRREIPWPDHSSLQLGLKLIAEDGKPSSAAGRRETQERVRQALDMLPAADQEILGLRYLDGFSYKEVADFMAVSENAAAVRCHRALKRFRGIWLTENPQYENGTA